MQELVLAALLLDVDFMGSADNSSLSSELFPIPRSPQRASTALQVLSRVTGKLQQPNPISFIVSIGQTERSQPSHFGCSRCFFFAAAPGQTQELRAPSEQAG